MILKLVSNVMTLLFLSFHVYNHYKTRKTAKKTGQYPYIFIVLSLLFAFEQTFMFVLRFLPFYIALKFILVCAICFPYTNIAHMLYKEYLVRVMKQMQDNCDDKIASVGFRWRKVMIEMYDKMFEAFKIQKMTKDNAKAKSIELKSIKEIQEDIKAIKTM